MQAFCDGLGDVFVLDTFVRYSIPSADVAQIKELAADAKGDRFALGAVETRRIAELMSQCLKYSVEIRGHQVVLRRRAAVADDAALSDPCRAVIDAMHSTYSPISASQQQGDLRAVAICTIEPAAAAKHVAFAAQLGEVHIIKPIADRHEEPHWVLDIPGPLQFDARPRRCSTCHNNLDTRASTCKGLLGHRVPLSQLRDCPPEAFQEYFPVTSADICQAFPGAMVCRVERKRTVYLTHRFFREMA